MKVPEIQEPSHSKMLRFLRGQKPLLLERIIFHDHPEHKHWLYLTQHSIIPSCWGVDVIPHQQPSRGTELAQSGI
jgi:hypothetical protein